MMRWSPTPPRLAPQADALQSSLQGAYDRSMQAHARRFEELLVLRPNEGASMSRHVLGQQHRLMELFAQADAHALSVRLAEAMCLDPILVDDVGGAKQRLIGVLSAVLGPRVALRQLGRKGWERFGDREIAHDLIVWSGTGTTAAALACHADSDARAVACQPARSYELVVDMTTQHGIDSCAMIRALLLPVLEPLGGFRGMLNVAHATLDRESGTASAEQQPTAERAHGA